MDGLTRDLLAARDGDRVAFAAVVRASQGEIWRFCAHMVGRADADDVTQDVYVRVVRSLRSFRGEASARTWLFGIARRACADAVRQFARARRRERARRTVAAFAPDASSALEVGELIDSLPGDQRLAFVLTQLHGLSYEEAAAVCGVPVGTIRSRVARARSALVERLRAADAV